MAIPSKAARTNLLGLWEVLEKCGFNPSIHGMLDTRLKQKLWDWSDSVRFDEDKQEGRSIGVERFWATITKDMWDGKDDRGYPPDFFDTTASGRRTPTAASEGRTLAAPES